jgi:dTDP-4-amino-4,6-dideoxygalactose transaminase
MSASTSSPTSSSPSSPDQSAIPLLDLIGQYHAMREDLLDAVTQVLDSQQLINGEAVAAFEHQVANYCECAHAVGVSSGTDALLAGLLALGVGRGDEVIVPAFTFFATAGSVARAGATPIFADIEPATFNLDPEAVAAAVTQRTKAIMPAHLFGQTADMTRLTDIARRHSLFLIEDAAQALGATHRGQQAGTIGECGCFSFFPSKNLGGAGDAGMVVTDDADLADRLRSLRNHGATARYYHEWVGGNFRLDTIQAAYLSAKLPYLNGWAQRRRQHAAQYEAHLHDLDGVTTPGVLAGNESVSNQYVIRAAQRDALQQHLKAHNIGSAVYYPKGLHEQPCFADLGYKRGDLPITEQACEQVLALPVFPELTEAQTDRVCDTIRDFYRHGG